MKNKLLLLVIFCFTSAALFAQNCGYMGKRFFLNADLSLSPAWTQVTFLGEPKYYSFNYIFSPNIEVIAWKKGSAGISGHYFKTKYKYAEIKYDESFYMPYWERADKLSDLNTYGFGLFYKQYFGKTFAPMGAYVKLQFDCFFYNYTPESKATYDHLMGIKFELGKDYLWFNRLRFSFGATIGTTFQGYNAVFSDKHYKPIERSSWAKGRILGAYWLGVKMSIGILAF